MDRVLELVNTDSLPNYDVAIKLITPTLLQSTSEQQKHKLKTRISALLKKSGKLRAYGAVLARRSLVDWSIVKSHGSSWTIIMLHALALPDQVVWKPAIRTLTYLFSKVHGKADLARDIAGSKIGDFMKRLVATLPATKSYGAVEQMLKLYPTQCRAYLNKLEPLVRESPQTEAFLCISEKQSIEVWTQRLKQHLAALTSNETTKLGDIELTHHLQALSAYVRVAPAIKAKVPAEQLVSVLLKLLATFTPAAVFGTCEFISTTFPQLKLLYLEQFETLVYALSDCVEMGTEETVAVLEVITQLMEAAGWISENYNQLFTRLTKRSLAVINTNSTAVGAQGLADYIQNPDNFAVPAVNDTQRQVLVQFLTTVVVNVPSIPQSSRLQLDKIVLKHGSAKQMATVTLYPSKYSVLPLTIQQLPHLAGLESLVHPRFPPLHTSKHLLQNESHNEEIEESSYPQAEAQAEAQVQQLQISRPEETVADETVAEETVAEETVEEPLKELPQIPEPNKPVHRPVFEAPPEKRAKLETSQLIQPPAEVENEQEENDEMDDEMVIPTLNMDSD